MRLAKNLDSQPWAAFRLNQIGDKLKNQGYSVIFAAGGEPNHSADVSALENGIRELIKARGINREGALKRLAPDIFTAFGLHSDEYQEGYAIKYAPMKGDVEKRRRLAEVLSARLSANISSDEIVMGVGGTGLLNSALKVVANPNETIFTPMPYWGGYKSLAARTNTKLVPIDTSLSAGILRPDNLIEAIQREHTRQRIESERKAELISQLVDMGIVDDLVETGLIDSINTVNFAEVSLEEFQATLVLNYPNNPTGVDMAQSNYEDLEEVINIFGNINVVEDSIYKDFSEKPLCMYQIFPKLRHRIVLMGSGSKVHAMAGERIGYAVAPSNVADAIASIDMSRPSVTAQEMLVSSEENLANQKTEITKIYAEKIRLFKTLLEGENILSSAYSSKTSFYCIIDMHEMLGKPISKNACEIMRKELGGTVSNTDELAVELASRYGVIATPGTAFGLSEGLLRVVVTGSEIELEEMARRLIHAKSCARNNEYENVWEAPPTCENKVKFKGQVNDR